MADFSLRWAQRSGTAFAGRFEKPGGGRRHGRAADGIQREGAQGGARRTRLDGRDGLLQDQAEYEERRRALLLPRYGFVFGIESGNSVDDSRGTPGERAVLRRLRTSERDLLSVYPRAGAERQ